MILLRLQTITSCKTKKSITDICLLFSLQIKSSTAVRGLWNSKSGQNRSSSNDKVSAKERHTTWRYFGFELLQGPLNSPDSAPSDFYFFPNLASLETSVFYEGIARHEHRLIKCTDVKGDYNTPISHKPFLGSSNSAANKDMISKIWTNGDRIIWLSREKCEKRGSC